MKYILFIILCLAAWPVFAADAAPKESSAAANVPVISFMQQVDIVVKVKKDSRILDMKIAQDKEDITLNVITDYNVTRPEAKMMVSDIIMETKGLSLDDPPKTKELPGKGLYNYRVMIARPDGVMLMTAVKAKAEEKISFQDPFQEEPLTRAGATD